FSAMNKRIITITVFLYSILVSAQIQALIRLIVYVPCV
ncbi:MAG: hypothetical protein ACI9OI_001847, partial [Chitinophagales bacterium]